MDNPVPFNPNERIVVTQDDILASAQEHSFTAPTVSYGQPPMPPPPPVVPIQNSKKRVLIAVALIIVVIGAVAGTAYAYVEKVGPFASTPYTERDLLSGLLEKVGTIDTSAYLFNASIVIEPREADAKPFMVDTSNRAELEKQYANDSRRAKDVSNILYELVGSQSLSGFDLPPANGATKARSESSYPSTLADIANKSRTSYYREKPNVRDPVSKVPYSYLVTDGGKNFRLSVIFETKEAVAAVRKGYKYAATTTIVSGQTVTFTKDSSQYLYVPAEPPKPYFIQLQEMASLLPPEIAASLSLGATSDWSKKDNADWKFNVDATGDFGDLTYKVNVDAQKNEDTYYFRINNIPSLFGSIASYKGQWIKVDSKAATTSDPYGFGELSYAARQIPEAEESYKKNRAEFTDLLKKVVTIGDEEGLVAFKKPPYAERVDGRQLYRFEITANKVAILPFYKRMVEEAQQTKSALSDSLFADQGLVEYLESKEFTDVFDYYQKNTTLTLWVDAKGYPAIAEYTVRFVPQDNVTALKEKQVKIVFKLTFSDINKPVKIEVPADAKTVEEVTGANDPSSPLSMARAKGFDSSIKSNLASIRVQGEIYYDANLQYGTAGNSCLNTKSLFTDQYVKEYIVSIEKSNGAGVVVCNNTSKAYAIASPLTASDDTTYWCIDSTGTSAKRTTPLGKATVCPAD